MPRTPLPDAEQLLAALIDTLRDSLAPDTGLIGIHTGGVWIAERLHAAFGLEVPCGSLDVSFYRDDYERIGPSQCQGFDDSLRGRRAAPRPGR
jgi:pyrimidine operon attenuation protein/uracil phosphoribosyltransferase